jgi:small-conductance mechanosensitive channel
LADGWSVWPFELSQVPWGDKKLILHWSATSTRAVAALLNIVLVIAILGLFGVETTSFAALIAAAGVAIGMAWSGY